MQKQSKIRDSLNTSHHQAEVQPPPEEQGSVTRYSYLARQMPLTLNIPTSQLLLLSMMSYDAEYSFGHPQPAPWWGEEQKRLVTV